MRLPLGSARERGVVLAFALLSGLASHVSLVWTRIDGGAAALSMSNGLLASVLLLVPATCWPRWALASALGQVGARFVLGDPLAAAAGLTLANLMEAWSVATWVRRRVAHFGDMGVLVPLSRAALSGTLLACAASATLATAIVGVLLKQPSGVVWLTWVSAHVLGMVIVGTLLLCMVQMRGSLIDDRAQFIPDVAPDGAVVGFCSFGLDITRSKQTERELERLAHFHSLTELADLAL